MATTNGDVGRHLLERYARQGYDVTRFHVTRLHPDGWLAQGEALNPDGHRILLTATGTSTEITSERITDLTDDDPFKDLS
jgi:hypothetical protein